MPVRRFAFALLAVLTLPAACCAGPIEFNFTATAARMPDPGAYTPGELVFALTPQGNVTLPAAGGSLELGGVQLGASPGPLVADFYTGYAGFAVSVAVNDTASGRSGTLTLYGDAVDEWTYRAWDGREMNTNHRLELGDPFAGNTDSTTAVIGRTRYTLSVRPENDNQAGVYTLSATVANPEPGTFALAAIGLAPLVLRRLRWAR